MYFLKILPWWFQPWSVSIGILLEQTSYYVLVKGTKEQIKNVSFHARWCSGQEKIENEMLAVKTEQNVKVNKLWN